MAQTCPSLPSAAGSPRQRVAWGRWVIRAERSSWAGRYPRPRPALGQHRGREPRGPSACWDRCQSQAGAGKPRHQKGSTHARLPGSRAGPRRPGWPLSRCETRRLRWRPGRLLTPLTERPGLSQQDARSARSWEGTEASRLLPPPTPGPSTHQQPLAALIGHGGGQSLLSVPLAGARLARRRGPGTGQSSAGSCGGRWV